METFANLESFVRSAECKSFSAAARSLSLTPAAVSRNVAMLEGNLGVRLFQRSTRNLILTEAGTNFLDSIRGNLEGLKAALDNAVSEASEPQGTLKVSLPFGGIVHILPLLPEFLRQYPRVRPEWHFENRQVNLAAEGYDAAIGGNIQLGPGIVFQTLAPAHIVAVASPSYLKDLATPSTPADLSCFAGIVIRSLQSGRITQWTMRNKAGREIPTALKETIVVNDPAALREAARLGLGVALAAVPDVIDELENGSLVRLLPKWYADAGSFMIYYPTRKHLPKKTRAFVDYVIEDFNRRKLAKRWTAV